MTPFRHVFIQDSPIQFIDNKKINLADIFEGDIEKLRQGYTEKAILEATSNKSMYVSVENTFKIIGYDLGLIKTCENLIVHKNCEIDKKFLENFTQENEWKLGEKLICNEQMMTSTVNRLCKFVRVVSKTVIGS